MSSIAPTADATPRSGTLFLSVLAAALGVVLWAYWPNLREMAYSWSHNAEYSHGWLVPVFAAFLLWLRRDRLQLDRISPSWWGALLLVAGAALRLAGARHNYEWVDAISLLPTLAGLCLLIGGGAAWRWAWPAILFLFFMVPLPFSLAKAMSMPLQTLATISSTFLLQTFGMPAVAEGTTIRINEAQIGIVEACSGLRMLVVFFALSTGMVMVIKAPLPDKLFLVASSVPIALTANIIRITVTGMLHEMVDSDVANIFFHDVAGWLMMPLALGMLWLELKVLAKLFVEAPRAQARTPRNNHSRPSAPPVPRPRPARPRAARRPSDLPPEAREPAALSQPQQQSSATGKVSPQGASA
jgi:exosortase